MPAVLKVKVNSSPVERLPESQMDCSLVVVCGADHLECTEVSVSATDKTSPIEAFDCV